MSIIFNTIPVDIRTNTHHIEVDSSRAVQGVNRKKFKILVMGTRLSTGTVAELIPRQIRSGDQADQYFGIGSMLAESCRAAKVANKSTEMWACAIEPLTGGTAGTKTLTITGTTTADGNLALYVDGRFILVAIPSGTAQNAAAALINTAIQGHKDYSRLPYTTGVATNVVTFTMRWKGVGVGDVRVNYNDADATPAGMTATVAAGTAGAGNPDITSILTAIGGVWYDTFINPWNDSTNLGALETFLKGRFGGGPSGQKEGYAFSAVTGDFSTASSLGLARNSAFNVLMGANTSPTASWKWAAVVGAVESAETDPARPRQTLSLPGLLPAKPAELWEDDDRNTLLYSGVATHVVDDGGNVTIERLVTTYQKNSLSVPDPSFLDIETLRTLSFIRYDRRAGISLSFPRHKLTDDETVIAPGQPIVSPSTIRAHGLRQFQRWQELGLVEDFDQFSDEYIVIRDPNDVNRVQEQMGPNLINQFRGLSSQVQFIL